MNDLPVNLFDAAVYLCLFVAVVSGFRTGLLRSLATMFGYSTQLRSLTQGRATYTMEFKHYAEAPKSIADSIINKDDKPKK